MRSADHYVRRRLITALTDAALALCEAERAGDASAATLVARRACGPRDLDLVKRLDTVGEAPRPCVV